MEQRLKYKLSRAANKERFTSLIIPADFSDLSSQKEPHAVFVGGQPGAGKTGLQGIAKQNLSFDPSELAVINGDDFRSYHPDYEALLQKDDTLAAFYTDADTGSWIEQAVELAKSHKSNVLIEGTLRRPQTTIDSAALLKDIGYRNELHVIAAHEFFCRLRIFNRYLKQRGEGGAGRYTLLEAHNASYRVLPESLAAIIKSGVFGRVVLYSIERKILFDSSHSGGDVNDSVQTIVSYIRSRLHQSAEKMLVDINCIRQVAIELNCNEMVMDDIAKLNNDVLSMLIS